ncbi:ribose-phosphate pyrophosphokinase [Nitzschia inconspicua]|uniref:ribose-phosphate diphosphokinase n=1 Tax=Nitzschia inconspicua TaxID=303405 RepID=A0A9K3KKJ6_9STRA|nr:ribose-phosphate pyrophosphokinase [Nitzschia inconspicua]
MEKKAQDIIYASVGEAHVKDKTKKYHDPLLKLYHGRPLCINQNEDVSRCIANGAMCEFRVDNLDGGIVGLDYFGSKDLHNPVVVSPDAGGVYRAKKFKEGLMHKYDMQDIGLAMIVKQRARAGLVDTMDLVGDVSNCDCILVDDMIDTAGTLCKAADVLIENGARRVFAFASHGLLSGPGNDRIANSKMEEVVILNTLPTSPQREANEKLTMLSVAPLLAQAIFNIHAKKSISALFK